MGKGGGAPGKTLLKEQFRQSKQIFEEVTPARTELTRQITEALTTGGVGARIPIIQQIVESAKQAGSQAIAGTKQRLSQLGLDRSPLAAGVLGPLEAGVGQQVSRAGLSEVQRLVNLAGPYVQGSSALAVGSGGQAAQSLAAIGAQEQAAKSAAVGSIGTTAGTLGAAALPSLISSGALTGLGTAAAGLGTAAIGGATAAGTAVAGTVGAIIAAI